MDVISQFNLPNYLKGKTFAEASKMLDDKFKDRTDPESVATMNDMQGRLKQAQEFVKSKQEEISKQQHQMPDGSVMEGASHPEVNKNTMKDGGILSKLGGLFGGGAAEGAEGAAGAADGVSAGSIMGAATGAMNLASMIGDNDVDTSGRTRPEYVDRLGNTAKGAMSGAQVGGAIVPGLGHAIGAIGGGLIGGFSGPSNEDITTARANNTYAEVKNTENNVARFGLNLDFLNNIPARDKVEGMDLSGLSKGISDVGPGLGGHEKLGAGSLTEYNTPSLGDKIKFGASKLVSPESLRYAPAAMNIAQLSGLDKPEDIAFGRSDRKYDQQLVDEQGLQNTVRQATASNRDAILSSSGGSSAKARASLLGSQLTGTRALSQAYQQAGAENRQEGRAAQQFDSNTERFNIGQSDKSQLTNLQQDASYQTNKSKLLSQIGNDLGGIGQEELFKKYPELAGLGYDSKGRKIKK